MPQGVFGGQRATDPVSSFLLLCRSQELNSGGQAPFGAELSSQFLNPTPGFGLRNESVLS